MQNQRLRSKKTKINKKWWDRKYRRGEKDRRKKLKKLEHSLEREECCKKKNYIKKYKQKKKSGKQVQIIDIDIYK